MSLVSTPNTSHVARSEYASVYEPAEDTFLLLDALEQDKDHLRSMKPTICMEIGSGSGCVSTFLHKLLDPLPICTWATDINPAANRCTLETYKRNDTSGSLDVITTVFAEGTAERLENQVDVLVFNPPYVVTPSNEVLHHPGQSYDSPISASEDRLITATWAGGVDGREVVDRFWPTVNRLLSPTGVFYLVVIQENNPDQIIAHLKAEWNLHGEVLLSRRAGRELLSILKFVRAQPQESI